MLGQVCRSEYYQNLENDFKEAFVVHNRHSRVYLFNAKLPNTYLARITEHGAQYARHFLKSKENRASKRAEKVKRSLDIDEEDGERPTKKMGTRTSTKTISWLNLPSKFMKSRPTAILRYRPSPPPILFRGPALRP